MKQTFLFTTILLLLGIATFGVHAKKTARSSGEIELLSATVHSIKIQLIIPETDFNVAALPEAQLAGFGFPSLSLRTEKNTFSPPSPISPFSFPGADFTTQPGMPPMPVKSALIGVPPDADFTLRIVQSDFRIRTVAALEHRTRTTSKNRFFPDRAVEIKAAGWIRENRVLPIQLNPVQYNPVTGEVKFYHRLIVEVQFHRSGSAPPAMHRFLRPESPVYDAMLENMLINPHTAKQWRAASLPAPGAPATVLPVTPHYKIVISQDGMYHITGRDLAKAIAEDIDSIVPATFKLSNKGRQIPIFVRGESDGSFDPDDEIVFYGQRNRGETTYFDPFSDENIYWLTWSGTPGIRMGTKTAPADIGDALTETGAPPPFYQRFLTRTHFEKDQHFARFEEANLAEGSEYLQIGAGLQERFFTLTELPELPSDSWFWTPLPAISVPPTRSKTLPFELPGVARTGLFATLRVQFYGRSNTPHQVNLWLNDKRRFEVPLWNGQIEFQFENQEIPLSFLQEGTNTLRVSLRDASDGTLDRVMFNWFEVEYWRTFEAKADVLPFSITPFPEQTNTRKWLKNFSTPNIEIYGVDGTRYIGYPIVDNEEAAGTYKLAFDTTQTGNTHPQNTTIQYIALTREQFLKPEIQKDRPANLRSTHNGADYIIITDTLFIPDVQALANFRAQNGMRTKVVDVQNIYDEFNYGIVHPYAVREFLKYAYQNWQPPAPTYVFLVGDTHNSPKTHPNFVPTIQVQIPGYGSSASDHQFVTFRGNDSFPDMLIGRIPATNRVDVRTFVEHAINYETNAEIGPWQKRLLMLAGTDWRFHSQTEGLLKQNEIRSKYEITPIYAPITQTETASEQNNLFVGRQVIDAFNDGVSIVNYIGHGAGGVWSSSRMLDLEDPEQNLTNIAQLPFVISMTCYTAHFDGNSSCLAEELLRSQNGGAIAVIGGTSIGLLDGDYILNRAIFDVIFKDKTSHIGAILAEAKTLFLINAPSYFDLAEVFTLFGDPATQLRLPHTQMKLTADIDQTSMMVSGALANHNFTGNAEIVVFPRSLQSSRDTEIEPPPPERETVPVVNGQFTTEILLPANSQFDNGNIQAYAWNTEEDAIGYANYNALQRYLDNVRIVPYPVEPEQPVHLYTEVRNKNDIEAMTLFWSLDGFEFETIPVVQHTGSTYRSEQPIPGYPARELIDYYLEVEVRGGKTFQTEIETYEFGLIDVDLTILQETIAWNIEPPFTLSAQIRNRATMPARDVSVHFFQMPTQADTETTTPTLEALQNATQIGEVQMLAEVLPETHVIVSVPWQPPLGNYLVTVVIDLPSEAHPKGNIIERRELNNIAARQFKNNRILLTPKHREITSVDGALHLSISPESLQSSTVMTFEQRELSIANQPDIFPIVEINASGETVADDSVAYHFSVNEPAELKATASFIKPANSDAHIYMLHAETRNWIRIGNETLTDEKISTQVTLPGTFALLSHADSRPPILEMTVEHQGFIDGDYVSKSPTISARIEDANGIDPRTENLLITKNGTRVPQDEYVIASSPVNSRVLLVTYTPVLEAGEYRIRLQAQDANGNSASTEHTANVAGEFAIKNIANFPNPFRSGRGTDFAYYLTERADEVSLKIYTLTGRLISTIDTLDASVSYNEFHYDGIDADGEPLANGVYLYKFTARKDDKRKQKVGKIVVLK